VKIFARTMAIGLLTLGLAACGDEDTGPGEGGSLTASIDGEAFTASLSVQATYGNDLLVIGGVNGSQQQIMLSLPGITSTGTVNLGAGNLGVAQVILGTQAWTTSLVGGTGSVTVTSLDANGAKGTFTFTGIAAPNTGATGTKAVTNGSFDVKF